MSSSPRIAIFMALLAICLSGTAYTQSSGKTGAPRMSSGVSTVYALNKSYDFNQVSEVLHLKDDIVTISIQYKGLTEIPKEIAQFKNLEVFDLSHNNLRSISPSYFSKFKKLKRIYLNNNPITKEDLKRLQDQYPGVKVYYLQEHFH